MKPFNVAIIGLGFGAEFIPIYQRHPLANMYAICQRNAEKLQSVADAFNIEKRYTDYDELLKDPAIDVVHINTPIQNHAEQSLKALRAGKHVACTVPMATSVEDCRLIVEAVKETGCMYMMMETVVYSREFLFVKEMYQRGEMGILQFLRASHQQEMAGWPGYWEGLPPIYSVYVNDELFAERTWIWADSAVYLEELLQIEAEPGEYQVRYELVPPNLAQLAVKNMRVEHGPGQVDQLGQLRIEHATT